MSAPTIEVFFPDDGGSDRILSQLVSDLVLNVDLLPADFPFSFSAQRRDSNGYLLIEYNPSPQEEIEEISGWEKPSRHFKQMLKLCKSKIVVHYRGIELAKQSLQIIATCLGEAASRSVVENDHGCLLNLAEMINHIAVDSSWTWERDEFPELDGVASSEWTE
jgi:hypothetical protein